MDTVHCCMFLALILIVFVGYAEVQHEDGITYVSTTGIDNISCFNAGIDNPCRSFNYVLLNSNNSCDDNCVIIILDSQSPVINSTNNIIFRESQSLHVSSINLQMVNVSFGDIQISSNGSSNLTIENLTLVLGSISVYLFKQIEFRNVVVNCSKYGYTESLFNFSFVDTVLIHHAYFQTYFSEMTYLVSAEHVNTAVVTNCSFIENNNTIVLSICAYKLKIEHCTFENNYAALELLYIDICYDGQVIIDYNITTCSFINNTGSILIFPGSSNSLLGTMHFSSNSFQRNTVSNQPLSFPLIFIGSPLEEVCFLLTNNSFTYNIGAAINILPFAKVTLENTSFGHNMISQKRFYLTTTEYCAVVYIKSGIFQMKNVRFFHNTGTPLVLINILIYFMGINTFLNNVAMYGGGIYFDSDAVATFRLNSHVVFVNNTAQYGGAVYIGKDYHRLNNCVIDVEQTAPFHLTFLGNSARSNGANILSYQSWCDCHPYHIPIITWDTDPLIVSYPSKINVSTIIELYPGKSIKLNFSVIDCNGTASACDAYVLFGCADRLVCTHSSNSNKLQLAGPGSVFLSSGVIDTAVVIEPTHYPNHQNSSNESTQLYIICKDSSDPIYEMDEVIANITIHLIDCPLGLVYDNNTKQCRCAVSNTNSFLCSAQQGQVCIRKGYWYTHIADNQL